ncbi:MAG: DMT family transporter [Rhodospirillales bacterium]|jgi:drug/metabolite transporter (DMT)-like permease|nr:DMT family transporter [Rhodospirillales bacterium]
MLRADDANSGRKAITQNIGQGIGLIVLAIGLLSSLDAMVKWLTGGFSLAQIVFFRNLFGLLPVFIIIQMQGGARAIRTRRPGFHIFRVFLILTIAFSFFWALSRMELADATALFFTVPLFITIMSVIVLGETVGMRRWIAVAAGFGGVLLVIRPGSGVFDLGAIGVLVASLGYAALMISNRAIRGKETPATLTFFTTTGCVLVTGCALPWVWVEPSAFEWGVMAAMGIFGGTGQILLIFAFQRAPAGVIAPFEYTTLIWATFYGFVIWGDLPDMQTVIGAAIIAAGGVYILYRETMTKP